MCEGGLFFTQAHVTSYFRSSCRHPFLASFPQAIELAARANPDPRIVDGAVALNGHDNPNGQIRNGAMTVLR